ncbi:MAG: dTDP-4-dehydrorhamnose reductase [Terriglobia bacterium]
MRILITGCKGMLGQDLVSLLSPRHQVIPVDRGEADITDANQISPVIAGARPDMVIHTAAYTAVDDCERNPDLAFRVNAEGTRNVASACRRSRAAMVYISTDYVFDGKKNSPFTETDAPNPINVYGRSKLQGEKYVAELVEHSWIVRTSWLFGPLGKNFVEAILARARQGESLWVVDDQVGAPTYTIDLAEKLVEVVERGKSGVYHVTGQGYCSWFEFAQEILAQAGLGNTPISPIDTDASARPAPRPRNSRLANTCLLEQGLGLLLPWQNALGRYLARESNVQVEYRCAG